MATEIRVPALGESVTEATIGRWMKQAGEAVSVDEPLVRMGNGQSVGRSAGARRRRSYQHRCS